MKVLSAGCSFIWGSELSDDTPGKYSNKTWPALWAHSRGYDYACVAQPGVANNGIVRRVIDYVETKTMPDLVVVQWTFPGRHEFRFNNIDTDYYSITPWSEVSSWEEFYNNPDKYPYDRSAPNARAFEESIKRQIAKTTNTGIPELSKIWFKYITNLDSDRYYYFKEVAFLKSYLDSKSIPYVFTAAESLLNRDSTPTNDTSVTNLRAIVDSCPWVWFEYFNVPMGFMEWARASRQQFGSTHPLDLAHQKALTMIEGKLDEIFSKSN